MAHKAEITYYKELFDLRKNSTKELWANLNKVCRFKNSGAHQMVLKIIVNNKELTQLTDHRQRISAALL